MDRLQDREEAVETTCFLSAHGELRQEQVEKLCFTLAAGMAILQACRKLEPHAKHAQALMDFTVARCFLSGLTRPLWQPRSAQDR